MNIIKSFIYFVLAIQEKFLRARLSRTIGIKNNSKQKKVFGDGCLLSLESLADAERNKLESELSDVLKEKDYNPEQLLEYIKEQGTQVFYIKSSKQLSYIGENEGFIYPQNGLKAVYLSLLAFKKIKFKTNEIFILSRGANGVDSVINKFYFIYHFYNWFMYKNGISGMDSDSIKMLNKYMFCATEEDFKKLQLADIYKLKEAIKQDRASIEFVLRLCQDLEGVQKAFKKIKDEGANI